MKVFIDEDTGAGTGKALRNVYIDAWFVSNARKNRIKSGTRDEVWIPIIAGDDRMILSRNVGMLHPDHERQILIDHNAAVVFFPQRLTALQLLALILRKWDWLEFLYENEPRPFAYVVGANGYTVKQDLEHYKPPRRRKLKTRPSPANAATPDEPPSGVSEQLSLEN